MISRPPLLRPVLAAAVVLALLVPAGAPGAQGDGASTSAYIHANLTLLQVARGHLGAAEAAPLHVLAQVTRECPQAALASPQDPESTQLSNEVIGAMVLSAYHLDTPAIQRFVAAAGHLRWSSAGLTRTVHEYVSDLRVLAALAPPHLCADVRSWVAGGYASLPPATVTFDRRFMPAWVAIGLLPGGLAASEAPQERGQLRRSMAIEVELTDGEARAVESWGKIMNELGLSP